MMFSSLLIAIWQVMVCSDSAMSLWPPCGLHGLAVPNTVTVNETDIISCADKAQGNHAQ
jgi:hypothetical protein